MAEKPEPPKTVYIQWPKYTVLYGRYTTYRADLSNEEYIFKSVADKRVADAIKPIVEVYGKYKKIDDELFYINNLPSYPKFAVELINNLWQAIKATVEGGE